MSLCILGKIEGADSLEQATDAGVQKWFDDLLASAPRDTAERVRSAIDSVKFEQ